MVGNKSNHSSVLEMSIFAVLLWTSIFIPVNANPPVITDNFIPPVWCDNFTVGGEIQGYIARDGVSLGGNAVARIVYDDGTLSPWTAIQAASPANIMRYFEGPPIAFRMQDLDNIILPEPEVTPLSHTRLTAATGTRTTSNNSRNVLPGDYATVTANSNAVFTGGTYYIRNLTLGSNNADYTFEAGDYYIGSFSMNNGARIRINGQVNFHIGTSFISNNNSQVNNQAGYDPANLRIFLYQNPNNTNITRFETNNNVIVRGMIYSVDQRTRVEIKNNSLFEGGIAINGTLLIEQNSEIIINNSPIGFIPGGAETGECISYLRISHPSEVVSCTAAPVQFTACANDDCSVTYDSAFDLGLTSSAASSLWLTSPSQNPTVFRMPATGQLTVGLANVPGGLASINSAYFSEASSSFELITGDRLECDPDCNINFIESGIVVSGSGTEGGYVNPISPTPAGELIDAYLWAVRTDPLTGACAAELDNVTKPISLAVECLNPSNCAGDRTFELGGSDVVPFNSGSTPIFSTSSLSFTQGRASLAEMRYRDVGQYRVHARLTIVESEPTDEEEDRTSSRALSGTSGPFILHPYALQAEALEIGSNSELHSDSADGFTSAGAPFNIVVRSLDSGGGVTPSFGRELPLPQLEMVHEVSWPTSGVDGLLSGPDNTSPHSLPGHMLLEGVRWSEVGRFSLFPTLLNGMYLGEAAPLSNTFVNEIGHFYPDRFEVVTATSSISSPCTSFVYMEQPEFELALTVNALNRQGAITQNYNEDYTGSAVLRLAAANIENSVAPGAAAPLDTETDRLSDRLRVLEAGAWEVPEFSDWVDGVLTLSLNNMKFERQEDFAVDGPFNNVYAGVHITSERDSRDFDYSSLSAAQTLQYRLLDGTNGTGTSVLVGDDLNSIRVLFGRLSLENIFGPENEVLPVMMRTEFWNGSRFAVNLDDSCTPHDFNLLNVVEDPDSLSPIEGGNLGFLIDGQLMNGDMIWANSDTTATGIFLFDYNAPEWLRFKWDASVDDNVNPKATAEFGRFRARDRVIYWLEQR